MEWISIDKKLPKDNLNVLTIRESKPSIVYTMYCVPHEVKKETGWKKKDVIFRSSDLTNDFISNGITHWMPIAPIS